MKFKTKLLIIILFVNLNKFNFMKKEKEKIRIIPKLETKNGFLIKGVKYEGLRKMGNIDDYILKYYKDHADQINIIDIVASLYSRDHLFKTLNKSIGLIDIPICVGGGVKTVDHIRQLLLAGADRVIINSEGLKNIEFLKNVKNIFGSQFISISIETKKIDGKYICMMHHGRDVSNYELIEWINELSKLQVGEIIINSIDHDGTNIGFDKDLINKINTNIDIPLIYSGGLNDHENILELLKKRLFSGISIGTALHFDNLSILKVKNFLNEKKININLFDE